MIRSLNRHWRTHPFWQYQKNFIPFLQSFPVQKLNLVYQQTHSFSNQEKPNNPAGQHHTHTITKEELLFKNLLEKAKISMMKGDYTSAEKDFEQALEISFKLPGEFDQFVGVCYSSLGNVSKLRGDWKKSREYYLQAYNVLSKNPAKHRTVLLHIEKNLGNFAQEPKLKFKDLKESKQKLEEEITELKSGERTEEKALKKAAAYNSLGTLYQQEGNTEKAIEYKQKALKIYESSSKIDPSNLFFIYLDLGIFYRENRLYPQSLDCCKKSLKLVGEEGSDKSEGLRFIALYNMGKVYTVMKEYDKAVGALTTALEIKEFSSIRDELVIRNLCYELGLVYFFKKDGENAIKHFQKVLDSPQKAGDENFLSKVYQKLGESYLYLENDFENAKKYFKRALNLKKTYVHDSSEETKALKNILDQLEKIQIPK